MLKLGADPKEDYASEENNALTVATENNHIEVVRMLSRNRNCFEDQLMLCVCYLGDLALVSEVVALTWGEYLDLLVTDQGFAYGEMFGPGDSPLSIAAARGHHDVLQKLLNEGATVIRQRGNLTYEITSTLLAAGISSSDLLFCEMKGHTFLPNVLQLLHDHGAKPRVKALLALADVARFSQVADVFDLTDIINVKVKVSWRLDVVSPLEAACSRGGYDLMLALCDKGAFVTQQVIDACLAKHAFDETQMASLRGRMTE